jgi:hypothetical protein
MRSKNIFTWTQVRHPIALYESLYKWLAKQKPKDFAFLAGTDKKKRKWHPKKRIAALWDPSFAVWMDRVLTQEPMYVTRLYEWYCGPQDGEFVNFIGRTETLRNDFFQVLHLLGYPVTDDHIGRLRSLGPANAIRREVAWPSGLAERVCEVERLAIKRFYGDKTVERRVYAGISAKAIPQEATT